MVAVLNQLDKRLISPRTPVKDVKKIILETPPGGFPEGYHTWTNVQDAYREICNEHVEEIKKLSFKDGDGQGTGIVIAGGGCRYFPSLYVNIRILRLLGCTLPIEVWYIGSAELDHHMISLLTNLGDVECRDAEYCPTEFPARIMGGWPCKVFSIINSKFEEVLFLDADNTPLVDPTFLFDEPEYKRTGLMLWPDAPNWQPLDQNLCRILGIKYFNRPQVESGQVLINKRKCWQNILLAKYYCDFSDMYFYLFYGDKISFELGARRLDTEYAMPKYPQWINNSIFGHHAMDGSLIFSHRVQCKIKLDGSHPVASNWPYEQEILDILAELRGLWSGLVWTDGADPQLAKQRAGRYVYHRVGIGSRDIVVTEDGTITEGSDSMEKYIKFFSKEGIVYAALHGTSGVTAVLREHDHRFVGRWANYEKNTTILQSYEN